MAEFTFNGVKTINAAAAASSNLTLSSDAAKQKSKTLQNREIPGSAQPIEGKRSQASPSNQFIQKEVIEDELGKPSAAQSLKATLINTGAGIVRQRDQQIEKLQTNLPKLDLEQFLEDRKSEQLQRPEESSTESGESNSSDKSKAAKSYQRQLEQTQESDGIEAKKSERGSNKSAESSPSRAEKSGSRLDLAAGGATDAEKGAPPVNFVA